MSTNFAQDILEMQTKYGVHEWIKNNPEKVVEYLKFRLKFLLEELNETDKALSERDGEEFVDGCIDLCVVAIGTLDALNVDVVKAWNSVLAANMNKEVGIKKERPNPLGLPDLIKGPDWVPPSHEGNHGILPEIFS